MKSFITFLFLFVAIQGCKDNSELRRKAETIKKVSIEKKLYEKELIYVSLNDSFTKNVELPRMKLFDSKGSVVREGSCMNYLDDLIEKLAKDDKDVIRQQDSITIVQYLKVVKPVDIDALEEFKFKKNQYKFYIFYSWISYLELFTDKKNSDAIYEVMRKASSVAKQNNIKLFLIHTP